MNISCAKNYDTLAHIILPSSELSSLPNINYDMEDNTWITDLFTSRLCNLFMNKGLQQKEYILVAKDPNQCGIRGPVGTYNLGAGMRKLSAVIQQHAGQLGRDFCYHRVNITCEQSMTHFLT